MHAHAYHPDHTHRRILAVIIAAVLLAWPAARALAQQAERGAPPPTLTDTPADPKPADAIDRIQDGMPPASPPPPDPEAPMTTPKPPPTQVPAPATADAAQRGLWAQLDRNRDGRISASEGSADADFSAHFAAMDANADGFVSDGEYSAHRQAMREPARER